MTGLLLITLYVVMAASTAFAVMVIRYRQINKLKDGWRKDNDKIEAQVFGAIFGAIWPVSLPVTLPVYLVYKLVVKLGELADSVAESKS